MADVFVKLEKPNFPLLSPWRIFRPHSLPCTDKKTTKPYFGSITHTMDSEPNNEPFKAALVRKLIQQQDSTAKISQEAVLAVGQLLKLFVLEARERAAIQAECEHEASGESSETNVQIQAHHVSKIAAELLMDFT
jgi:hypothetical protein